MYLSPSSFGRFPYYYYLVLHALSHLEETSSHLE